MNILLRLYKKPSISINSVALIISLSLLVLSFVSEKHFETGSINRSVYISSKVVYLLLAFAAFRFLIYFVIKSVNREKYYVKWLRNLLFLLIPYVIFLLLTWPGIFVWDEFGVYQDAASFIPDDWQSFQTSFQYLCSLYLFPSIGTIVAVQLVFMAFISSWFITKLELRYNIFRLKYLLFLILIASPPIVFNSLMTYRSTGVAILELWLIGLIYFGFADSSSGEQKRVPLVLIGVLTILLSTWRKEGIYHVILVPIAVAVLYKSLNRWKLAGLALSVVLGTIILGNVIPSRLNDKQTLMDYQLTSMMNPLSNILADKNAVINGYEISVFSNVISVDKTKAMPYPYETPSYWNGAARAYTAQDFARFKKEYAKVVLQNFDLFMGYRTMTFFGASGFNQYGYYPVDLINRFMLTGVRATSNPTVSFTLSKSLNQPFDVKLRQYSVDVLNWSTSHAGIVSRSMIFWDFIPILLALLGILIRFGNVRTPLFWLVLLSGLRVPLLFLTEPGSYFMYYYPMYLTGIFVVLICILERLGDVTRGKDPTVHSNVQLSGANSKGHRKGLRIKGL